MGRELAGSAGDGGDHIPQRSASPEAGPGALVAGRYRVERTLGEGTAGVALEATDLDRKERVVLKFLAQVNTVPPESVRTFLREAASVGRLGSEHIARVLDAGITEDGALYLVREYLSGQSLARTLRAHGPLPVPRATEYVIETCEGLADAHSHGIVHGDIKPYKLYLAGQVGRSPLSGSVRIVDFGISKFAFSSRHSIVTSLLIGYLPPESLRSDGPADPRSDVWSLGATLFELLTGQPAYDTSQTLARLVTAILDEPPPCPRNAGADVPEELAGIVRRCLSKSPEARFQSVRDLAVALLPWTSTRAQMVAKRAGWGEPIAEVGATPFDLVHPLEPARHREPAGRDEPSRRANSPSLAPVTKTLVGVGASAAALAAAVEARRTTDGGDAEVEAELPLQSVPRWLAAASVAMAGAAVFSGILLSANDRGSDRFGSGAAFAAQAPTTAPAPRRDVAKERPPSPAPEIFQLVVRATPESAQITIDGTAVEGNPYRALYPKGGDPHRVTVSADGYESRSEDISLNSDVTVDLDLKRSSFYFENRSPPPARPLTPPTAAPSSEGGRTATADTASSLPSATSGSVSGP